MNRKSNQTLWLKSAGEGYGVHSWLTAAHCGTFLLAMGQLTGYEWSWISAMLGAAVCVMAGLWGRRGWFHPAVLGVMALLLLVCRDGITDGFCRFVNGVGEIYTSRTGVVIPTLEVQGEGESRLILFGILGGMAVGLLFCALSGRGTLLLAAFTAIICCAASAFLRMPVMVLPLLFCALQLLLSGNEKSRLLPAALLAAALLLAQLTGIGGWSARQSEAIRETIHNKTYETKYTTLPEGSLTAPWTEQSELPALVVTMEKPEALYLRGFTGAVVDGECWMPLDPEILAENRELLYWLNLYEFDLRSQFEAASAVLETEKNTVTVQNIGACSNYRYTPFSVRADDSFSPEHLSDTLTDFAGRYDVFTTVYGGAELVPQILAALEQSEDAEVIRYRQAEGAYRAFVQEHYLTVPEDMASEMAEYWAQAGGMEPQSAVQAVMELCFPEGAERTPGYATAAVLTLRHFGIPARYAEGYIVPETKETSVTVNSSCAACWAEVYQDGIGWIPMALTASAHGDGKMQQSMSAPSSDPPQESLPQESTPENEPDPSGGYRVSIAQVILSGALTGSAALLLTVLVLLLRRGQIVKKRRARFEQPDTRDAVGWIFTDAVSVLDRMGIQRGKGSLDALTEPIRERFGSNYADQFRLAAGLNARALFSSREMPEEDRKTVLAFRDETLARLRANSKWYQKLWMRLVLCLY